MPRPSRRSGYETNYVVTEDGCCYDSAEDNMLHLCCCRSASQGDVKSVLSFTNPGPKLNPGHKLVKLAQFSETAPTVAAA